MNSWWRARPARYNLRTSPAVLALATIGIVGVGNYYFGQPQFSFVIFYLPSVALVGWLGGSALGAFAGIEAALAGFVADMKLHPLFSNPEIPYWNGAVRALVFVSFGLLFAILRQHRDYLQQAVAQKTAELKKEITERGRIQREVSNICAAQQRQIAYDLHDGVGQHLSGIAFKAKVLEQKLRREGSTQAGEAAAITGLINEALRQTRLISRSMEPSYGTARGLRAALEQLTEELSASQQVTAKLNADERLPMLAASADTQLFRIAQEAIHNATTHGNARHIDIDLKSHDNAILLRVRDDGRGFDGRSTDGMGMRTMQYRAHAIGGSLDIASRTGAGTVISCHVPVERSNGDGTNKPEP